MRRFDPSSLRRNAHCEHLHGMYKVKTMLTPIKVVDGLTDERGHVLLQDPPLVPLLFSHAAAAWLWLGVRLWLGYQWLTAASHKLADPAWTDGSGSASRR